MPNERQSEVPPGRTTDIEQRITRRSMTRCQHEAVESLERVVSNAVPSAWNGREVKLDWEDANELRGLIEELLSQSE